MSNPNATENELAIRRLIAAYCHCYDDGLVDDYCALFTEDGEFTVFGRTSKGRDAIRKDVAEGAASAPPGQHVTYNAILDVGSATATGATDFLYLTKTDDGSLAISNAGRYLDEFQRTADGWRIKKRVVRMLGDDA